MPSAAFGDLFLQDIRDYRPNCDLTYQRLAIEIVSLRPLRPQYTILHVRLQELVYGIQQWILCTFPTHCEVLS